jgi:cytochrome o ubiquinol oxidase subunit 3
VKSEREMKSRQFGFWMFLMSDALTFALLLAVYATMAHATDAGPGSHEVVNLESSLIQTLILLASSFTMAMASLNQQYRPEHLRLQFLWLALTLLLGLLFLGMEIHDFAAQIDEGAVPQRSGYLSAFYVLVGTHGLHVLAGCVWMGVLLLQLKVFGLDSTVKFRLGCLSLYWHFLDVIWVALYTIVYLLGVAR